ncbi:hypothetical protein BJX63DRAFT_198725 [Aspergillus granulosus]|uniref:Uncharacterized protein n=1 Tax=Aspergillus granulosus TaxID=176169 RepID=A0ABR4HGV9_9EURO
MNKEIEEYRAQLAPVVTRISKKISPRKISLRKISPRTETAASILGIAVDRLSEIVQFLEEKCDLTNLILETVITAGDPRTAFLLGSTDLLLLLLRALSTRYYVGKYKRRYGTDQGQANNPRRSGKIGKFLEEEELSGSSVNNAIKSGRKLYETEKILKTPGVWIPLMPVLPKLTHLRADDVNATINYLSNRGCPELVTVARKLLMPWEECLRLFTIYIGG